jgi:peptidoglycan/xylan/chitin deacetylase (PgdA/CDA1 family)
MKKIWIMVSILFLAQIMFSQWKRSGNEVTLQNPDWHTALTGLEINDRINFNSKSLTPMITFFSDDGYDDALNILKPILDKYNYPASIGFVIHYIGTTGRLTLAEIDTLQNAGWEIMSHSYNHEYMTTLDTAELHYEFYESKEYLQNSGFNVYNFMYPYGDRNSFTDSISAIYYRHNRGDTFSGITVYAVSDLYDLDSLKELITLAQTNNAWLTISTHEMTASDSLAVDSLVDYIDSVGIAVVTMNAALDSIDATYSGDLQMNGSSSISKVGVLNNGSIGAGFTPIKDIYLEPITRLGKIRENALGYGLNVGYQRGLIFNGTTSYVSIADDVALHYGTNSFTISAFVDFTGKTSECVYADKTGYSVNQGVALGFLTGNVAFSIADGSSQLSITNAIPNVYSGMHLLTMVVDRDSQLVNIYVDGLLKYRSTTTASVGSVTNTSAKQIGARISGTHFFNGLISQVRIFSTKLTGDDILQLYNNGQPLQAIVPPALTASLELDLEGYNAGTSFWYDISDNNLNGTCNNTTVVATNYLKFNNGEALFDKTIRTGSSLANGKINFVATDGDAGNIEINTSDALTFNSFGGGYEFDDDISITNGGVTASKSVSGANIVMSISNSAAKATNNRADLSMILPDNTATTYRWRHLQLDATDNNTKLQLLDPSNTSRLELDRSGVFTLIGRLKIGSSTQAQIDSAQLSAGSDTLYFYVGGSKFSANKIP